MCFDLALFLQHRIIFPIISKITNIVYKPAESWIRASLAFRSHTHNLLNTNTILLTHKHSNIYKLYIVIGKEELARGNVNCFKRSNAHTYKLQTPTHHTHSH